MTPERQVLYGLVAGGFHVVVLVLAVAGREVVPAWWSVVVGIAWTTVAVVGLLDWRKTVRLLLMTIGLFVLWMVGTLVVS